MYERNSCRDVTTTKEIFVLSLHGTFFLTVFLESKRERTDKRNRCYHKKLFVEFVFKNIYDIKK